VAELETVVAGDGAGFGGEAELVQDGVHEVAGAVAGEGSAGAVSAVCAGGEAEDEDAGARIAEAGDGARPVGVVDVGAAAGLADAGAVVAQARAEVAADDRVANLVEGGRSRGGSGPVENFERRGRAGGDAWNRVHRGRQRFPEACLGRLLSYCIGQAQSARSLTLRNQDS